MMNYSKVLDHDNLIRDMSTGAIINIDKSTGEIAKKKQNNISNINQLQCDVEILKNELSDIKNLLRELIRHGS